MSSDKKADEPTLSPDEAALKQRVENLMEGNTPVPTEPAPPAIDIFKASNSGPAVPDKLLEQIGAKSATIAPNPYTSEPAKPESEAEPKKKASELDDAVTDKAVDDIVVNEADTVLAAEDALTKRERAKAHVSGWKAKLAPLLKNKWTWVAVVAVLAILFGLPLTRYKILGLVIKQSVNISVTDSSTHTPVSSAQVSLHGVTGKTDGSGKAKLKVPLGSGKLVVTKQYYKTYSVALTVGFKSAAPRPVTLLATGRQVPITVLNKITGKPLAGAEIKVLDTTAKTDKKGQAIIVLPTLTATDTAKVSLTGYNTTSASIQVTSGVVAANTINLVPTGHLYFLSNLSGKVDVVKTNLDGSARQTVLAGTGKEDPNSTSLLASRDWRYLVLKAQRDTPQPSLYLIDTSTDKVTSFDNGDASFTLVGWYGHDFMYDVVRNAAPAWQNNHEALKSYNADNGQLNLLDQNQAEGNSSQYAYQGFYNFYILNGIVIYNTQWYSNGFYDFTGKSDTIRGVQSGGQGKKDYQSVPAAGLGYVQAALYEPKGVYYAIYSNTDNKTTYYKFEDQTVTTITTIDQTKFSQGYPTYLLSPSSSQTFWTELRDGKNTLFIGDQNAQTPKQIASLSEYSPYGWYSDSYVLVSKGGSQLYIMPAGGLSTGKQPLKVTDYYKSQIYNGYGYGYGGL